MEKERKYKLMWRWSLITAGAIALFWAIYYLVTGQVPVVTSIKMTPDWTLYLPFGMSRWWDILIGPIWSILLISIFTSKKIKKDEDLVVGLGVGLVASLVVGLGVGLVASLGAGLVAGLVASLVAGLGAGLVASLGAGLVALIKWMFSRNFWASIKNWLLAENTKAEEV